MSNGHTPGPWETSGGSIWATTPWNARVRILTAEVHSRTNGVDWAANLRLAAAAPDLLTALADILPYAQAAIGLPESAWPVDSVIFQARAAMAKATQP